MKFGQLIENNVRNIFFKNHAENKTGRLVPDRFLFFKKVLYKIKASGQHLSFNMFWWTPTYNKKKFITFQTVDPEMCSILIFYKMVWDWLFHHALRMIFQEKYFSCYILLTDRILSSGLLYFLRY